MYRKLHCDFSNGPYNMIAAATITSPSNNYGAAILFESGIYISRVESISLSAHARVYHDYDLQPKGTLFQPWAYIHSRNFLISQKIDFP